MYLVKLLKGEIKHKVLLLIFFLSIHYTALYPQVNLTDAFPYLTFTTPVDLQHPGNGTNRLFVVEQEGIIRVFENSSSVTEYKNFLDIRDRVDHGGEMGLLGLAFHPDYENNGFFYVNYTTESPERRSIISRFQVSSDPDSADKDSEVIFISLNQPFDNHNGGQLVFGPDGYLYIAFGDGGDIGDPDNNAQNRATLLGNILRIDVNSTEGDLHYSIPFDNPYKENTSGYREEIFAYGFRNPWRFSFDTYTGDIWCADVGQNDWEEIDIVKSGNNYGWRYKEGNHCYNPPDSCDFPGLVAPIWEYSHSSGGFSVTGGFVYRGNEVPELYGKYIYGDYVSKDIWALAWDSVSTPVNEHLLTAPGYLTSFGTDQNQELYACLIVQDEGKIYKFTKLTGIDDDRGIENVKDYYLSSAYPNPFNPSTSFSFYLPETSIINIDVINASGEIVKLLKDEIMQSGNHSMEWRADNFSSGIYFIRMIAVSSSGTRTYNKVIKAVLLK